MMKNKITGYVAILMIVVASFVMIPKPAQALCDIPGSGLLTAVAWVADQIKFVYDWFGGLIDFVINYLSLDEFTLDLRFFEFDQNTRRYFASLWQGQMRPSFQSLTRQLHTVMIDQMRMRGAFYDANKQNETLRVLQEEELEATRRQTLSETRCTSGTLAGGMAAAKSIGEALNVAIEKEEIKRRLNMKGTISANGAVPDLVEKQKLYREKFGSPDQNQGHSGVTTAGACVNCDIETGTKFMNQLTIDFTDEDKAAGALALGRRLVSPLVNTPIAPEVVDSPEGRMSMMDRRSIVARENVGGHVIRQMKTDRTPGTKMGAYTKDVMTKVGYVPTGEMSDDPSPREVKFTLSKLLLLHPHYFGSFMDGPEAVARAKNSQMVSTLGLERDRYRRLQNMAMLYTVEMATEVDRSMAEAGSAGVEQEPVK